MARNDPQVNIRLPFELKAALDEEARKNGRSTTAEIVDRLQASFPSVELVILQNRNAEVAMIQAETEKRIAVIKAHESAIAAGGLSAKQVAELKEEIQQHQNKLLWYKTICTPILAQVMQINAAAESFEQAEAKRASANKKRSSTR